MTDPQLQAERDANPELFCPVHGGVLITGKCLVEGCKYA